ncbi:MAG: DUF1559 domain-containing protein [Pirellulales bacterium]
MPSPSSLPAANRRGPAGFSLVELLVVVAVVAVIIALLLPAVQAAREAARRTACSNNVRQIAVALLHYETSNGRLPAAAIVSAGVNTSACVGCWNPWAEAREPAHDPGDAHGTSWMLEILPFIEERGRYDHWDRSANVVGNAEAAGDVQGFYCPSRRGGIRTDSGDHLNLPDPSWRGGGTDYGGSYGRLPGFEVLTADDHRFMSRTSLGAEKPFAGVFRPRTGVPLAAILDGQSNTLLVGELQRLRPSPHDTSSPGRDIRTSHDGWAVGGAATLFTTNTAPARGNPGGINNGFFESAGSDHQGGGFFSLADGSVHFIADSVDAADNEGVFPRLGSMSDGTAASLDAATR